MDHHRIHAEAFLAAQGDITTLTLPHMAEERFLTKSALLPWRRGRQGLEICLMQPVSGKKELGPAQHEICKGTRMWKLPGGEWVDLKHEPFPTEGEAEALIVTALREAGEEMQLPLDGVVALADAGVHAFTSASTGAGKWMQLFLAEMRPEAEIIAPDPNISGTQCVDWFSWRDALAEPSIRPDHRAILASLLPVMEGKAGAVD